VLLKWLAVQASCALPNNLPKVKALMEHPAFTITTPNCCYSLFLGFARSVNFHAADGSGYEFIGDSVIKVGSAVAVCSGGGDTCGEWNCTRGSCWLQVEGWWLCWIGWTADIAAPAA
jgi:hypothetical protein